jgi:hypothetical protein
MTFPRFKIGSGPLHSPYLDKDLTQNICAGFLIGGVVAGRSVAAGGMRLTERARTGVPFTRLGHHLPTRYQDRTGSTTDRVAKT